MLTSSLYTSFSLRFKQGPAHQVGLCKIEGSNNP